MKISPAISERSIKEIQSFGAGDHYIKPAISAYSGTVFKNINPGSFDRDDFHFANDYLRILSGMYGILKPLDGIEPYRLEMKTPLFIDNSLNLSTFWKDKITAHLLKESILSSPNTPILNLASNEYIKALDKKSFRNPIITIIFKELIDGKYKTVGMYAKVARGIMVRKIIKEKIEDPKVLQKGVGEYRFNKDESSKNDWVFIRGHS